ncbi:MAG: hypothetical protein H6581_00240 [Bacteroidia bacterium]|nr:hypothetical protein [Bacteroidia bacterium]
MNSKLKFFNPAGLKPATPDLSVLSTWPENPEVIISKNPTGNPGEKILFMELCLQSYPAIQGLKIQNLGSGGGFISSVEIQNFNGPGLPETLHYASFSGPEAELESKFPVPRHPDETVILKIGVRLPRRWSKVTIIAIALNVRECESPEVNVKCLGAVGDGHAHPLCEFFSELELAREVYPDATCLQDTIDWAAIQKAVNMGRPVVVPVSSGNYIINKPVRNPGVIPIICHGVIEAIDPGQNAFEIGQDGTATAQSPSELETIIRVERNTGNLADESVGIVLTNVTGLTAHFYVSGFPVGINLRGENLHGCAYNKISLQRIKSCRVGLRLSTSGDKGFVNQNTFIHGRFSIHETPKLNRHGVEFTCNNRHPINGNLFLNPCFEGKANPDFFYSCFHGSGCPESHIANNNLIVGMRMEGPDYLLSGQKVGNNEFRFTYGNPNATVVSTLLNGSLELVQNRFAGPNNGLLFKDEPEMLASWGRSQLVGLSAGNVSAPPLGAFWDGDIKKFLQKSPASLKKDHFEINETLSFPGILFDLRTEKSIHLRRIDTKLILAHSGGRVAAVLFDDSNKLIKEPDQCTLSILGSSDSIFKSGSELTVSDGSNISNKGEIAIVFGEKVAFAFIGVSKGNGIAFLKEIRYYANGQANISVVKDPAIYAALADPGPDFTLLDTLDPVANERPLNPGPGNGYPKGTFVRNFAPAGMGTSSFVSGWIWDGANWLNQEIRP